MFTSGLICYFKGVLDTMLDLELLGKERNHTRVLYACCYV